MSITATGMLPGWMLERHRRALGELRRGRVTLSLLETRLNILANIVPLILEELVAVLSGLEVFNKIISGKILQNIYMKSRFVSGG